MLRIRSSVPHGMQNIFSSFRVNQIFAIVRNNRKNTKQKTFDPIAVLLCDVLLITSSLTLQLLYHKKKINLSQIEEQKPRLLGQWKSSISIKSLAQVTRTIFVITKKKKTRSGSDNGQRNEVIENFYKGFVLNSRIVSILFYRTVFVTRQKEIFYYILLNHNGNIFTLNVILVLSSIK